MKTITVQCPLLSKGECRILRCPSEYCVVCLVVLTFWYCCKTDLQTAKKFLFFFYRMMKFPFLIRRFRSFILVFIFPLLCCLLIICISVHRLNPELRHRISCSLCSLVHSSVHTIGVCLQEGEKQ